MSRPFINQRLRAKPGARAKRRVLLGALAVAAAGCVLDTDDRCGPNQVAFEGDERCVCAEGSAYTPDGCVPCGEHESVTPTGCACVAGYLRGDDGVCAEVVGGIGVACTSDAECTNPTYPHCQTGSGGGYCTSLNCDAGCDGDYSCNLAASPTYCQRAPTGVGTACTSDADCASFDANYCELFVSRTCLVRDCSVSPESCFSGFECCAFAGTPIPNLCLAEGLCTQ